MTTIPLALAEIKTLVQGISSLNGVYLYPDDYASVNTSSLPIAIVSHAVTLDSSISRASIKQHWRYWHAEVTFLLSEGELTTMGAELAQREIGQEAYVPALYNALIADTRLGGTANDLTDPTGNELMRVVYTPYTWGEKSYWAIVCIIPVKQLMT